jgi:preprotein translocase subunit SecF
VLTEAGYADAQVKGATLGEGESITNTVVMILPGNLQEEGRREEKAEVESALIEAGLVAGETVTETFNVTDGGTVTPTTSVTGTATVTSTQTITATETTTGTTGTTGPRTETRTYQRIVQSDVIDFRSVGPTVGAELLNRAIIAIAAASLVILLYLTFVFRRVPNAIRYGVCAIIALIHDVFVVVGIFAILGLLFGVEIDALFITAMLTVIGFSVHDTIVVFDRVRENIARRRFERFEDVVNYSVVQTLARSINTSVTVVLTLFALYLFGGTSIRNFVLALLIGIISGTFSSIFNASMLLVIWENREWRRLFGGGRTSAPATRAAAR